MNTWISSYTMKMKRKKSMLMVVSKNMNGDVIKATERMRKLQQSIILYAATPSFNGGV
jgi:hypothetical protein